MKRLAAYLLPTAIVLSASAQTTDLALVNANMGRVSCASNAETVLYPQLALSPARKTLLAGETLTFTVAGETNPITWFQLDNPSGASASSLSITSLLYTAGSTSDCIDVIEAWDGLNKFGRARVNVISPAEVARAGKAIVIAGQSGPNDPVWPISAYLGDLAYNTLRYRGFSRDNIQYLRAVPTKDVDGNGLLDDVDLPTSFDNAALTFTNWASNLDRLFVYLVDHGQDSGGNGYFRLNGTDTLPAATLDAWLDRMQDTYSNDVTILIDCCYAGSFVDELDYPGPAKRTVIAACGTNQPTYFAAGGLVSFSDAFFSGVLLGLDINSSFNQARNAMDAYQEAMLDDTGDGAYQPGIDGAHSATQFLGSTFVAGKDIPQIGLVLGNQLLLRGTTATLWADDVVSLYPIDRVWCLIVPPSHNPDPTNPVSDLVQLDMPYDAQAGRYQAAYSGFSEEGVYKVMYYAKDMWDSVSLPRQSFVTQAGFDERVVLVAAGAVTNDTWPAIDRLGQTAYRTFRTRWFEPDAVLYLSADPNQDLDADGTNDVDALPTLANLSGAITNWAMGSDKLTVYLIGDGTSGSLCMNEAESLVPAELDYWLDVYQQSNAEACVVLDAPSSGSFLSALRGSAEYPRIAIASCADGQACNWSHDGLISFSQQFLTEIYNGVPIWDAFTLVRRSLRKLTRYSQEPLLDDTGDGLSTKTDGDFARTRYIGTAFMTGADAPGIGAAGPEGVLAGAGSAVLWAEAVTDLDGISNVWCFVTGPEYAGTGELPRVELAWDADSQRYEAQYAGFTQPGSYVLTFQAQDSGGEISSPLQCELFAADAYEPDDTAEQAAPFEVGGTQAHNRHASDDADWVVFYAPADTAFEIEARQVGTNSDVALEVFTLRADGTLTNLDWLAVDDYPANEEQEVEYTAVDLALDPELQPGLYYVKVTSAETNGWGADSEYELRIWVPVGGGQLVVVAIDKLGGNSPPPGAVAIIDGVTTQAFGSANSLSLTLPAGAHTVEVPPVAGYLPEEDPKSVGQVKNPASYWFGNPKQSAVTDDQMRFAVFSFVPVLRAEGTVLDAHTGGWVPGARVEFIGRSGVLTNVLYDGYPAGATYKSSWWTRADGTLPTNVWLPTVTWDLRLSQPDYANRVWTGRLAQLPRGTVTNLGPLYLTPIDTNANQVADGWEARHFPRGGFSPTNDADGDRSRDGNEYLLGTDPTNAQSVLAVSVGDWPPTNGLVLRWPIVPGRTYDLLHSGPLASGQWTRAAGPWLATNGQTQMRWTQTNAPGPTGSFYRVNLVLPE